MKIAFAHGCTSLKRSFKTSTMSRRTIVGRGRHWLNSYLTFLFLFCLGWAGRISDLLKKCSMNYILIMYVARGLTLRATYVGHMSSHQLPLVTHCGNTMGLAQWTRYWLLNTCEAVCTVGLLSPILALWWMLVSN